MTPSRVALSYLPSGGSNNSFNATAHQRTSYVDCAGRRVNASVMPQSLCNGNLERHVVNIMKIHEIKLPKTQRFACSKKTVREFFDEMNLDFVSFGKFGRTFKFDHRCHHRPRLSGSVVANLTISSGGSRYMILYPVSIAVYDEKARENFVSQILPQLKTWLVEKLARPGTSPDVYEEIIVEWDGRAHKTHGVRFQTGVERVS